MTHTKDRREFRLFAHQVDGARARGPAGEIDGWDPQPALRSNLGKEAMSGSPVEALSPQQLTKHYQTERTRPRAARRSAALVKLATSRCRKLREKPSVAATSTNRVDAHSAVGARGFFEISNCTIRLRRRVIDKELSEFHPVSTDKESVESLSVTPPVEVARRLTKSPRLEL